MRCVQIAGLLVCFALSAGSSMADDRVEQIRQAVQKTIPWLEKGAAGSSAHNKCFTCHNHGLPIMALTLALERGFAVDEDNLQAQVKHTYDFLKSAEDRYKQGKGQGGRMQTAGYALWALKAAGQERDELTQYVAGYLLQMQSNQSHWRQNGKRPPSDGIEFTTTFVSLQGVDHYCADDFAKQKAERIETVSKWLERTKPKDTEDTVFRLRSLSLLGSESAKDAVEHLLSLQRPDGGWAQLPDMESDAYATGTALASLFQCGNLPTDHPSAKSAIDYLLKTQLEDGTWHVVTRADGFQPYYESGFPHGEDQFISMSASSWSIIALMESFPKPKSGEDTISP